MTRSAIALQSAYAIAAAALLTLGGIAGPRPRIAAPAAIALGIATAVLLYTSLARGRARPQARLLPAAAGGVFEEVVWRWGALAGTAPFLGWPAAYAASTVGFAGRHARGRAALPYLVLGTSFGGVFLATGRLEAAVAAHAAYNLLALGSRR